RHTRSKRDWSSDVCSSDLEADVGALGVPRALDGGRWWELIDMRGQEFLGGKVATVRAGLGVARLPGRFRLVLGGALCGLRRCRRGWGEAVLAGARWCAVRVVVGDGVVAAARG